MFKSVIPPRAACALLALALAAPAWAQESPDSGGAQEPVLRPHYGLLRMRDLTPFGFLRLDMRPAHAVSAPPKSWGVEVELGYQNTWAMSPNVQQYLTSLPGRRKLGPADIQAIRNLPGEAYLVDMELGLIDITLHYKLTEHWGVYGVFSAVHYGGGFLDGTIESFHKTFGLGDFARPKVERNDINVILDLKRNQLVQPDLPENGVLDPTFGLRYTLNPNDTPWNLVLEGAVKIPYDGQRAFLSTGYPDVGLQATLQKFWQRHAAYLSMSGVHTKGSDITPSYSRQFIPTLVVGYEYQWTSRTNVVVQGYASRSVFTTADTDLADLLKTKYQISVGMRYRVGESLLTFAVTENLGTFNNTPDIGLQLGWAFSPVLAR
jgi:hypothetical protein